MSTTRFSTVARAVGFLALGVVGNEVGHIAWDLTQRSYPENMLKYLARVSSLQVDTTMATVREQQQWAKAMDDAQTTYSCDNHVMTFQAKGYDPQRHDSMVIRYREKKLTTLERITPRDRARLDPAPHAQADASHLPASK